jgi:phosphoribulokinase
MVDQEIGTRSASLQVVPAGAVVASAAVVGATAGAVVAVEAHAEINIAATIKTHINFQKLPFIGYSPPCKKKLVDSLSRKFPELTVREVNHWL